MRQMLLYVMIAGCVCAGHAYERMTFRGTVTVISDSLGYVAAAHVATGDPVEYVFCVDTARPGFSQTVGRPTTWFRDTVTNGQPIDYFWDSLASVPKMALGATPAILMYRGTRARQDSDVVNVGLGDYRYDNSRRLKAVCIGWREYKGSVYDTASYYGFETIEQPDSSGTKRSSYFYFSLTLVKVEVGVAQSPVAGVSGGAVRPRATSRLVCTTGSLRVPGEGGRSGVDMRGRVVAPLPRNRAR